MFENVVILSFGLLMCIFLLSGVGVFFLRDKEKKVKNSINYSDLDSGEYIIKEITNDSLGDKHMICYKKGFWKEKIYVKNIPKNIPDYQKKIVILGPEAMYSG